MLQLTDFTPKEALKHIKEDLRNGTKFDCIENEIECELALEVMVWAIEEE